jgi:hypothetical protein
MNGYTLNPDHLKNGAKLIKLSDLRVRIHGPMIVAINKTPHYQYIVGNKSAYMEFLYEYHASVIALSLERFEYVINGPYDYLGGPHNDEYIKCDGDMVIVDGVHRATRLFQLGIKEIPVMVI